mgnify:CR=1 FL=1
MPTPAKTLDALSKRTATKIVTSTSTHAISLYYHDTEVAYYRPGVCLSLSTGGWMTATTKSRINDFCRVLELNVSVTQKDHGWSIHLARDTVTPWINAEYTLVNIDLVTLSVALM